MKQSLRRLMSLLASIMMLLNVVLPTGAMADPDPVVKEDTGYKARVAPQPTQDYNYRSILGNGVYFGITANKVTQVGDLQTNFAVKQYQNKPGDADPSIASQVDGTGESITPNLSGTSSGNFYVGEIVGNLHLKINPPTGQPTNLFIPILYITSTILTEYSIFFNCNK